MGGNPVSGAQPRWRPGMESKPEGFLPRFGEAVKVLLRKLVELPETTKEEKERERALVLSRKMWRIRKADKIHGYGFGLTGLKSEQQDIVLAVRAQKMAQLAMLSHDLGF